MALNLTGVHIMANTNKAFNTKEEFEGLKEDMMQLFRYDLFGDEHVADKVFGMYPWVTKVDIRSFGTELGGNVHRGHIHMVVEIWHSVPKYSLAKLRLRLKDWLNANYGEGKGVNGWNVYVRLMPRYQENYANKETRWAKNDDIEGIAHSEKQRLEDERNMEIITRQLKDIRVLSGNEDQIDEQLHRKYNK